MTVRTEDVAKAVERIRGWPPEDREWWRRLLEVAPEEALVVAELVVTLDARPAELYS